MTKKTVFISGAGGYIGAIMVGYFLKNNYKVKAFDRYFFGHKALSSYSNNVNLQVVTGDTRFLKNDILSDVDLVIDLASISNDPAADLDPGITIDINIKGAINLAKKASQSGVSKYIYASSCSVYGKNSDAKLSETSELNPVSLYARSKVMVEGELLSLSNDTFSVTIARNATCYGLSPRMRFDLAVNIMTFYAVTENTIKVTGGGKQWRPFVHIADVAGAYYKIAQSPIEKVQGQIFNVGSNEQNYQMEKLARTISQQFQDVGIDVIDGDIDERSYNVSFQKIADILDFSPSFTIEFGAKEIAEAINSKELKKDKNTITVEYYKELIEAERHINSLKLNNILLG